MEATLVPIDRWMNVDEENVVYILIGVLLSLKKEWDRSICDIDDLEMGIMHSEISQTEKNKYCMFSLIFGI